MERLPSSDHFKELLSHFVENDVRFLIIGAFALSHYVRPRFTKDLDIWVDPSGDNPERTFRALAAFGAPLDGISIKDFRSPEMMLQIGIAPNRVDILTGPDGVVFEDSWKRRERAAYFGIPVSVIGKADLIQNKRVTGRPRDLRDIEALLDEG